MSDANSTTKLPSQVVITALLDEFKSFIESGHANYDVVATIDQQRYVIGCDFNHENHINTMRVYAWHNEQHPEITVSITMIEWET